MGVVREIVTARYLRSNNMSVVMSIVADNRGQDEQRRLDHEIERNRLERLRTHEHYSETEASEISQYPFRLFPQDFILSLDETDDFRALCAFSQVTMKPPHQISSHRKYIGPLIVKAKQLIWPLMHLHLKDTLAGIQEFQVRSVTRQAKELVQRTAAMRAVKTTKAASEVEHL